ncbi:PSMD7 isoform 2 [Pongo abelii]|uniref:PSMD7 isoform 2 n=1 Tax=Pongo abelii TaxID=9601 RepID=A0A2J8VVM2_PONAB|nr:PSMD7 isoform 2 [Pongo abelii]
MPELAVQKVVVHPLVLLSVVDHFNRVSPCCPHSPCSSQTPELK